MTAVTITNEPTRWVIHLAVWSAAQSVLGGDFDERLLEHAWEPIDPRLGVPPKDVDMRGLLYSQLDLLDRCRTAAERAVTAEIGEVVEVPFIEEDEEFWRQPAGTRQRLIAARDAIVALQLQLPVGAVA
jgi:hypothetical protein